jgi:hypothetical protein
VVLKEVSGNEFQDWPGPEKLSEKLAGLGYLGQFERVLNHVVRGFFVVVIEGIWALRCYQSKLPKPIDCEKETRTTVSSF